MNALFLRTDPVIRLSPRYHALTVTYLFTYTHSLGRTNHDQYICFFFFFISSHCTNEIDWLIIPHTRYTITHKKTKMNVLPTTKLIRTITGKYCRGHAYNNRNTSNEASHPTSRCEQDTFRGNKVVE